MKLLGKIGLNAILLGLIAIFLWFVFYYYQFRHAPLTLSVSTIKVPPGTGTDNLVNKLHKRGFLPDKSLSKLYAYFYTFHRTLKAGEYEITPGISFAGLLTKIADGVVLVRQFAIIEGWRYQDLIEALNEDTHIRHVLASLSPTELLDVFGSHYNHPEGLFFPDTYYYTWGDSDFDLIQQAYTKMQQVLGTTWKKRAQNLPYKTPYAALIVASLIEKETSVDRERPLIASVVVNRLNKNMLLQIDPTVNYGLGYPPQHRLTRDDLRQYSAYNTYRVKGLPPTPICLPGKASIEAALHPVHTDYFFYVSKGNGEHQFSQTYQQHREAIRKYLHNEQENDKSLGSNLNLTDQNNYKYIYIILGQSNLDLTPILQQGSHYLCKQNAVCSFQSKASRG